MRIRQPSLLRQITFDSPDSSSVSKRGMLTAVGTASQGGLRLFTSLAIGRHAGPVALGVVVSAMATAQLMTLLGPAAIGAAASNFIARARGKNTTSEAEWIASLLGRSTVIISLCIAALSIPLWWLVNDRHLTGAPFVILLLVAYSAYSFTRGAQFGAGLFRRVAAWDVASALVGIAGVAFLLLMDIDDLRLTLPLTFSYAAFALFGWPWHVRGIPRLPLLVEIRSFVILGTIGTMASAGSMQLATLTARWIGGSVGAGQFAAALGIATPLSLVASSLGMALFPTMSEAIGRGDLIGVDRKTLYATGVISRVMVGVVGGLAISAPAVISLVWGEDFAESQRVLPALLAAVLASSLGVPIVNRTLASSSRGSKIATGASVVGLMVCSLFWLATSTALGVVGVAYGYALGSTAVVAIVIAASECRGRGPWRILWARVAIGATIAAILTFLTQTYLTNALVQIGLSAVFIAVWLIGMRRYTILHPWRRSPSSVTQR